MATDDKYSDEWRLKMGLMILWIIALGIQMTGIMITNSQLITQNQQLMVTNQELKAQNEKISAVLEGLDNKVAIITNHIDKNKSGDQEQDFFVKANKRKSTAKKEPI